MARAMEVVQTSGPGARMRVTRAAFHSSGPLSSSFLLQSSTRTILSSRADGLSSPSLVWRPQEMSSTPLDAASDSCPEGEEPYRVTEPDDHDISEPSKWRSSIGRCSLRMPSEESSSADNVSIVDLNSHFHPTSTYSRRTDSSKASSTSSQSIKEEEPKTMRSSFRRKLTSEPLMKIVEHARCLESTKSQAVKSKDEWHDRRNSYGFEGSQLNGIKSLSDDAKIGIESSTDSGICKSTEIVNSPVKKYQKFDEDYSDDATNTVDSHPESFKDWLAKNRALSASKPDSFFIGRNTRDLAGQVNLTSLGKISISLPKSSDRESSDDDQKNQRNILRENYDISDRKLKKVEFCKTELHFAAESGIVNIIETDEKPPPKHDFRRRRSAFVPFRDEKEKPITLFGGTYLSESRSSLAEQTNFGDDDNFNIEQLNNELDDSTVKSILKNKISKPKPYLLGEDNELDNEIYPKDNIWGVRLRRTSNDYKDTSLIKSPITVLNESLNQEKQLTQFRERDHHLKNTVEIHTDRDSKKPTREPKSSPVDYVNLSEIQSKPDKSVASTQTTDDFINDGIKTHNITMTETEDNRLSSKSNSTHFVHEKLKLLQLSPIMKHKAHTRNLRQNELSYFGVTTNDVSANVNPVKSASKATGEKSVEASTQKHKSYKAPLYQNIHLRPLPTPVPAPRSSKQEKQPKELKKSSQINTSNKVYKEVSNNSNIITDVVEEASNLDNKRSTRVLETVNETTISSQASPKNFGKTDITTGETKRRSTTGSPNIIRVKTPSRTSSRKPNSKESVVRSRESSFENIQRPLTAKPHHCLSDAERDNQVETVKQSTAQEQQSRQKPDIYKSETIKYTELLRKNQQPQHIKETDSLKRKPRSSSVDSKDGSLRRNHSESRRSHSHSRKNGHRVRSSSKEKYSTITEESRLVKEPMKHPKSQIILNGDNLKERSRKKEYILNYDDKTGTLSSVNHGHTRHSVSKKHGGATVAMEKNEEKPKEVTRTSRVTTLQVKSPMILSKEPQRRAKSADHRSSRNKHRERPPQ